LAEIFQYVGPSFSSLPISSKKLTRRPSIQKIALQSIQSDHTPCSKAACGNTFRAELCLPLGGGFEEVRIRAVGVGEARAVGVWQKASRSRCAAKSSIIIFVWISRLVLECRLCKIGSGVLRVVVRRLQYVKSDPNEAYVVVLQAISASTPHPDCC
jgi:hypothetical protein